MRENGLRLCPGEFCCVGRYLGVSFVCVCLVVDFVLLCCCVTRCRGRGWKGDVAQYVDLLLLRNY